MINYLLVGIGLLAFVLFLLWIRSGTSSNSKVIDVRETPQRRIENLTVEQFHQKSQDFLETDGFTLKSALGNGDYLASRGDENYLVRVDPAAELRDPRKMNKMILNLRQSDAESGILVTTRSISGQSRSLAEKAGIRIIPPEELLESDEK